MITFVSYFVEWNEKTIEKMNLSLQAHGMANFVQQECPQKYLSSMFESAKQYHPTGRFVFITDETTQLEPPEFVETVRVKYNREHIETDRFYHMMDALDLAESDSHIIILDWDIIIKGNLDSLFTMGGDIFLTYQKESSKQNILKPGQNLYFPINIGFIGIHKNNVKKHLKY